MKRLRFLFLAFGLGIALSGSTFIATQKVNATFSPNQIIADTVFNNAGSMSAAQIDAFLNGFASSCISPNANANGNPGFRTPDPQGWSAAQNQYLFGGDVTAGQAIYDTAQLYSVNPQVILATLQKEQSIVSGSAGCHYNSPDPATATPMNGSCGSGTRNCTVACVYAGGCMNIALGYGCPNYCNVADEGFSRQLTLGTWLLRFGQERAYGILSGYQGYEAGDDYFCYSGAMVAGTRVRSNSSNTSCAGRTPTYYDGTYTPQDSGTITVANGASASLYNFTPFISGNRSFVNIFEGWFGTTNPPTAVKLSGSPASVSWGSGRIDNFTRGSDGNLWQKWFDPSGGWRPWSQFNIQITSSPAVSSWSTDRLDVFYADGAGDLGHHWFDGTSWQGPEALGKPAPNVSVLGAPSAVSWANGRIDVFARGSDGNLWQKWFDASSGWHSWSRPPGTGQIGTTPTVSTWAPGRLDIFSAGSGGDLQHYWFDNGWHSLESLGQPVY